MRRNAPGKSIYGRSCKKPACPEFPLTEYYAALETMVREVIDVIDKFFPAARAFANIEGNVSARVAMPLPIFIRLVWIGRNPGTTLNNDPLQVIQLKQIYYEYNMVWETDPLLPQGLT